MNHTNLQQTNPPRLSFICAFVSLCLPLLRGAGVCYSASVPFCASMPPPAISSHVWTPAPSPNTSGTYYGLALSDLNGDGRLDIVATKYDQGLEIWLNTAGSRQSAVGSQQSAAGSEQPAVGSRQQAVSQQAAIGSRQSAVGSEQPAVSSQSVGTDLCACPLSGSQQLAGSNTSCDWERLKTNARGTSPLPENGFYQQVVVCNLNRDKQPPGGLPPDILCARDGGGIELWTGKGDMNWELSNKGLPNSGRYFDVKAADLDSDGQEEIVAASGHGVNVWKRNVQGEWLSVEQGLPVYEYYHAVAAADLNLDRHLDLIAANSNNGGIKSWLGRTSPPVSGQGYWQYASSGLPTIGTYYGVTTGDINLDGRPDIVAASNSNQGIMVWLSDTSGEWKQADNTGLPSTGNYYSVICTDLNLDHNPDIIASNNDNEGLSVWLGDGQGHFLPASIGLPTSGYCHSIAVGDINLDKYPDIVAASSDGLHIYYGGPGNIAFLGWSGRMGYAADGIQPEYGTQGTLFTYQVNYINTKNLPPQKGYPVLKIGDNHYSMLPVNEMDNTYTDGRLYYYTTTLKGNGSTTDYSYQIEAIDTEGNIAIGTPVYPQPGPRVFMDDISREEWMQISTPETSREHYSLQLGDINMDGRLDVVAASSNGIKVWIAGDNGVWLPASSGLPQKAADFYYGISLVDFNLDGLMDIVATKLKGVEAWLGDGHGRWAKASSGLPTDGFFYGVAACDVNLDGFPDIIAGTNDQKGLRVWLGNGRGEWKLSSEGLPTNDRFCSVAVTDLNGDGNPDIVAGDYNGIRIWLHEPATKMEYSGNLPVSTRFDVTGQPDILHGRYDGIISGWTGDGRGKWTHFFTDLSGF